ncbi:hypothetical protein BKA93DRAFT_2861 [Sparassis latifolia]
MEGDSSFSTGSDEWVELYRAMSSSRGTRARMDDHSPQQGGPKWSRIGLKICVQVLRWDKTCRRCGVKVCSSVAERFRGRRPARDEAELREEQDAQMAWKINDEEYECTGDGIECGCCFSPVPFERMAQCTEGHLFCTNCMTSYASQMLGSLDANMVCMDRCGCDAAFPDSEFRRFLTPEMYVLYARVKQQQDIEAAGLENLEECPNCDFKAVIEDTLHRRVFWCLNEECASVTCLDCKKLDHRPKTCIEAAQATQTKLDVRHHIEEAMSQALIRTCPNCGKTFVKQSGCNNMKCPKCYTYSCYVCRQQIDGYDHFDKPSTCPLWEGTKDRHTDEVALAARNAVEECKRKHPGLREDDFRIVTQS